MNELENRIEKIEERNKKVEIDKAWETSIFRLVSISIITYIIASVVLLIIGVHNFLQSALIPTIGYILSTQSLPFLKKWWVKKYTR